MTAQEATTVGAQTNVGMPVVLSLQADRHVVIRMTGPCCVVYLRIQPRLRCPQQLRSQVQADRRTDRYPSGRDAQFGSTDQPRPSSAKASTILDAIGCCHSSSESVSFADSFADRGVVDRTQMIGATMRFSFAHCNSVEGGLDGYRCR